MKYKTLISKQNHHFLLDIYSEMLAFEQKQRISEFLRRSYIKYDLNTDKYWVILHDQNSPPYQPIKLREFKSLIKKYPSLVYGLSVFNEKLWKEQGIVYKSFLDLLDKGLIQ